MIKLIIILSLFYSSFAEKFVYEFGTDEGKVIYVREGNIPLLKPETILHIPIPDGDNLTYVKVVVDSISAPKVDYDNIYKKITIKFSWHQISASTYEIVAKTVPLTN